jgi:hypothetical protein
MQGDMHVTIDGIRERIDKFTREVDQMQQAINTTVVNIANQISNSV